MSVVSCCHFPDGDLVTVGEAYPLRIMRKDYTGRVAAAGESLRTYTCGLWEGVSEAL